MRTPLFFSIVIRLAAVASASACLLVARAADAPTELFVLWQGRGDWQCTLTVTGGAVVRAEPYMFLDARDRIEPSDARRVVSTTHSRGNAAGLHLFVAGGADCTLRLETNRAAQQMTLAELPAVDPKVFPIATEAGGFLIFGRGDPAPGPRDFYRRNLPKLFVPPVPALEQAIRISRERARSDAPLAIRLSAPPPGELRARRVSRGDGTLYLELFSPAGALGGTAEVTLAPGQAQTVSPNGSLWLALEPRIGRMALAVSSPTGTQTLSVPTTLVEVRGPRIFLNGEPFLVKGTLPGEIPPEDAEFIRTLGMNTLRGSSAPEVAAQYGFMAIASLQGRGLRKLADYRGPSGREQLARDTESHFESKVVNARAAIDNPQTLVLQLDNERTESGANPLEPEGGNTGADPWSDFVRGEDGDFIRLDRLLARGWNLIKPLAPMLPLGYANETQGYLAPEFLDVYLHNSYLPRDRYAIPFREFSRLQGGERRPFINTEWGSNRFTPESYHGARNSPLLEKIQAWGYRQTWTNFMDAGTAGGTSYKLYDSTRDTDQGVKSFGLMTADRQPKLACWEIWHMWRDFEIAPAGGEALNLTYQRDYAARECRLTVQRAGAAPWSIDLGEQTPGSTRRLALPFAPGEFRWRIDYTTHHGLPMVATGAWPPALEEADFAQKLAKRDTAEFLRPLITARVLTVEGREAPSALVDMTVGNGIIPIAFRCADGTMYVTAFTRQRLRDGHYVKADIATAFTGEVARVDEWTGRVIAGDVPHTVSSAGIVFQGVDIPSIPGPIGQRSHEPVSLPVFRIRPGSR